MKKEKKKRNNELNCRKEGKKKEGERKESNYEERERKERNNYVVGRVGRMELKKRRVIMKNE